MTKYYLEDFEKNPLLIRDRENALLERYDKHSKQWIPDVEMSRIYFGGILVSEISEEEANDRISKINM